MKSVHSPINRSKWIAQPLRLNSLFSLVLSVDLYISCILITINHSHPRAERVWNPENDSWFHLCTNSVIQSYALTSNHGLKKRVIKRAAHHNSEVPVKRVKKNRWEAILWSFEIWKKTVFLCLMLYFTKWICLNLTWKSPFFRPQTLTSSSLAAFWAARIQE